LRSRRAEGLLPGKVPNELLASVLGADAVQGPEVVIGPGVGEDAAVLRPPAGRLIVAKTDAITLAGKRLGWYLVHVNANDIAAMGGEPRWLMVTLLLPKGRAAASLFERTMSEIRQACAALGIEVIGGHSEITVGIERPMAVGSLLGVVDEGALVDKRAIRPGDGLYLAKGIAIEGTAALANDFGPELVRRGVAHATVRRARRFLDVPGISVVPEARVARGVDGVVGMHDPTEGGLLGAVSELCLRAECGIRLELDAVPVYAETREICTALELNPYALLASGALLVAVLPEARGRLESAFGTAGVPLSCIGAFVGKEQGLTVVSEGKTRPLVAPARDELARAEEEILAP
jgi:hydrogenase expression/formation protein HypE